MERPSVNLWPAVASAGAASYAKDWPLAARLWGAILDDRTEHSPPGVYARLAQALRRTGDLAGASEVLDLALARHPGDPDAAVERAELATARGDWPRAAREWKSLLQTRGEAAPNRAHLQLARARRLTGGGGASDQAQQACDRAAALFAELDMLDLTALSARSEAILHLVGDRGFWSCLAAADGAERLWRTLVESCEDFDRWPVAELLSAGAGAAREAGVPLDDILVNLRRYGYGLSQKDYAEAQARAKSMLRSEAFDRPVIQCGFHHSGTRLMANLLKAAGVFQVINSLEAEWAYIQALNSFILPDWTDPKAVAQAGPPWPVTVIREELAFRLAMNGYDGRDLWGHKDPRTCGVVDAWLAAFPNARIVHLVRDPRDVIGTLAGHYGRMAHAGLPPQEDVEHWTALWKASVNKVRAAHDRAGGYAEARFEDLCRAPRATLARVFESASVPGDIEAVGKLFGSIMPDRVGAHRRRLQDGALPAEALERIVIGAAGVLDAEEHAGAAGETAEVDHYTLAEDLGLHGRWPIEDRLIGLQQVIADSAGLTVLDLGCAEGAIARSFLQAGARRLDGFELSKPRIAAARRICADFPAGRFRAADLSDWRGFLDVHGAELEASYDIVLYLGLHQHLPAGPRLETLKGAAARASRIFAIRSPVDVLAGDDVEGVLNGLGWRRRSELTEPAQRGMGELRIYRREGSADEPS